MTTQVLITGGGIGGLACALACTRAGMSVALFERAPAFTEVGAGIQLGPNAVQVLHDWGLQGSLAGVAAFPSQLQVRSATTGAELGRLRLGVTAVDRYGAPYATLHRADLHGLLREALGQEGKVLLNVNTDVTRMTQNEEGVTLRFADDREVHGDVLVGADGLWSQVRQQLWGDGAPVATGHLAYRAMVAQHGLPAALRSQQITVWLGSGLHVVQYPVRGGEWLNVVAIVDGQAPVDMQNWDHSATAADLQRHMGGTCALLQDLIRAMDAWRLWALSIRAPMRGPHEHAQGRVALLGDAAHPMLPYLAQGAGMAIEDAQCLGLALEEKQAVHIPAALRQYAARRWRRNARVQARAIRNGQIFHATGPLAWGRDAAMKLLGERLLDLPWLYGGPP